MTDRDEIMERITAAVALHQGGDDRAARERFAAIWGEISPAGDAFHRCVLAHYMADAQDDPREELRWDLRALDAAGAVTGERAERHHPSLAIRGFYPSLHLNLAEDYRKLGDLGKAREHLARLTAFLDALSDDGYGNMIRAAVDRLTARLGETTETSEI